MVIYILEPKKLPIPELRGRNFMKFLSISTGNKFSGNSLVFSRKIITSTGFYRYCAPDASAPVVVINESPNIVLYFSGVNSRRF